MNAEIKVPQTNYWSTKIANYLVIITTCTAFIGHLYDMGIIQYQNSMFSIMPFIPYHTHSKIALAILAIVCSSFLVWMAHNYWSGKDAHDSYAVLITLLVFTFLTCCITTFYVLSTPMPLIGGVVVLLILVPLSSFFTLVFFRLIWLSFF